MVSPRQGWHVFRISRNPSSAGDCAKTLVGEQQHHDAVEALCENCFGMPRLARVRFTLAARMSISELS